MGNVHDDVIKWKHLPRYWPFVRGIHRSPVNSPHKGQWRGALMFSLICFWINGWVNNGEAGEMRGHRVHYDVTVVLLLMHANALVTPIHMYVTALYLDTADPLTMCQQNISHMKINKSKYDHRCITQGSVPVLYLSTPSHYCLNQRLLIISEVQWQSLWGNFEKDTPAIKYWNNLDI